MAKRYRPYIKHPDTSEMCKALIGHTYQEKACIDIGKWVDVRYTIKNLSFKDREFAVEYTVEVKKPSRYFLWLFPRDYKWVTTLEQKLVGCPDMWTEVDTGSYGGHYTISDMIHSYLVLRIGRERAAEKFKTITS